MILSTKHQNVFIDVNVEKLSYKIIQIIDGKNKIRRTVIGRAVKRASKGNPKHDMFGNQLYNKFNDVEDAKRHAINFVENHLKLNL